jgi:adenylyltransferase/sulfurtransferase
MLDMAISTELTAPFTTEELQRYSRQLSLPEFGAEGQKQLHEARVLIVGAGGLGCPAAVYLAAAGVGTLGIVEFDTVDITNIHRQILYGSADVGIPKIKVARDRIIATNSNVNVECFATRLTSTNALEIMSGFDVVIDASDNFATRYLVNDAAVISKIPSIYGSIHRFEGQLSVFGAEDGPCYRCLFRDPPPAGAVPNCAEAGVLGVLPGIIGSLQAAEAIKIVAGIGEPLIGRLLLFDALSMSFRTLQLRRDPGCPTCGVAATPMLVDYDVLCAADTTMPDEVETISPRELSQLLDSKHDVDLVDVREEYEWNIARIEGARLVPLGNISRELKSFDPNRKTVLYCKTGIRSDNAARMLMAAGISNVANLSGGIVRWSREVDPSLTMY